MKPPDTTEKIKAAIDGALVYSEGRRDVYWAAAIAARAADRKALAEAGWTVAPVVRVKESDFEEVLSRAQRRLGRHSMSAASEVAMFLQELGLPIEVME